MVHTDKRFAGLARYIVNVTFFWSTAIPTACAGHGFIFFNPDFYDTLPVETRKTVVVHEIYHLVLKHLERGKDCDPYIHNEAADYVINNALEDDGFTFDGFDFLKDPKFKGMSTEQIYNKIYKKRQEEPNTKAMDMHISAETIEGLVEEMANAAGKSLDEQKEEAENDVDDFAPQIGRATGNVAITLEVNNSANIQIKDATYDEIFKDYLVDPLTGGKRTFMRPNRRQHGLSNSSLKLPGKYKKRGHLNRLTHLVYGLDVSGSINSTQARQFNDSVFTIKKLLNPEKLTVLFFDTQIKLEKTFTDQQPYETIRVHAGGGTDLRDVYRRTAELAPEALVVFTDLCVGIPPKPTWDSIWLVPDGNHHIPQGLYGEVYRIPKDQ